MFRILVRKSIRQTHSYAFNKQSMFCVLLCWLLLQLDLHQTIGCTFPSAVSFVSVWDMLYMVCVDRTTLCKELLVVRSHARHIIALVTKARLVIKPDMVSATISDNSTVCAVASMFFPPANYFIIQHVFLDINSRFTINQHSCFIN